MPFKYQGQYYDNEVDLCYNRFRYYDCNTGSYISQDPIGLAGGNPTLYAFVKNVNTEVDILGLATVYLRNNEIYVGKAKQNAKTRYKSDKVNSGTDIFTDIPNTDIAQGVEQITYERLKESEFIDEMNPITNKKRPVNMDKKDKAKRREYGLYFAF